MSQLLHLLAPYSQGDTWLSGHWHVDWWTHNLTLRGCTIHIGLWFQKSSSPDPKGTDMLQKLIDPGAVRVWLKWLWTNKWKCDACFKQPCITWQCSEFHPEVLLRGHRYKKIIFGFEQFNNKMHLTGCVLTWTYSLIMMRSSSCAVQCFASSSRSQCFVCPRLGCKMKVAVLM